MITFIKNLFNKSLEQAKMAEHTFIVLVAIFIGVLGGLGSIGVRLLIEFFTSIGYGSYNILESATVQPWYLLILIPAVGGAIVGLVIYLFAKEAKGHGVPEVMASVIKQGGVIRPRVVFVKALASSICIGSGGSVGKEGPIVQIGASIGSAVGQLLKLSPNKVKIFLGCGVAAGIAGTFNAPIAGALFAVEIILADFGVAKFSPIVVSSVIATVVSRQFDKGHFPTFDIPKAYELLTLWELIPYVILGLLSALFAVLFIKLLYKSEDFFDEIPIPDYVKPIIGGVLIGIIGIGFPQVLGTGYEAVTNALHGHLTWTINGLDGLPIWYLMLALVIVKIVGTSLSLGSGGSGGVFAPSFFIGAMLGGGFGKVMLILFPTLTSFPETFPLVTMLVAMGALVSGTTHAPITAILIIFELTKYNYNIILPLMIACIISTLFARVLKKESIYTLKLIRKGVNIEAGKEINFLKLIQVKNVMENKKELIRSSMKLSEIITTVVNSSHTCFVVVDDKENIMGSFTLHDFKQMIIDFEGLKDVIIAEDIIESNMLFVKEEDHLNYVMNHFGKENTEEIPVLDPDEKKVLGVIRKNDVINYYNREILKADLAGGIADRISTIEKLKTIEVIEGYSMIELPIPKQFIGETLISASLRAKYGVMVILIRSMTESWEGKEESSFAVPHGDYIFQLHDRLLLFGRNDKIERMKKL